MKKSKSTKVKPKPISRESKVRKALVKQVDSLELLHDMLDKMLSNSNDDTERERARIDALNQVDTTEAYGYIKFPAPIADYLDYIKSTKNNLGSWRDLKSFITNTDMYWKTMRDQSLKIAIGFANNCRREAGVYSPPNSHNRFYDNAYYREIIKTYIAELERESVSDAGRVEARNVLLKMILDYSEHESNIMGSVRE